MPLHRVLLWSRNNTAGESAAPATAATVTSTAATAAAATIHERPGVKRLMGIWFELVFRVWVSSALFIIGGVVVVGRYRRRCRRRRRYTFCR